MAFGKRKMSEREESSGTQNIEKHVEVSTGSSIEGDEVHVQPQTQSTSSQQSQSRSNKVEGKTTLPLMDEVIYLDDVGQANPLAGGNKSWSCKHCKKSFKSSYTRIDYHLFGPPVGKTPGISRCKVLMSNHEAYQKILNKVKKAEESNSSSSLKVSNIIKKHAPVVSKPITQSFGLLEREAVDLKVIRGLYANGIPFNVLRNPQFVDMLMALKQAPKDYKAPSYERARTMLLDSCKNNVEKDLFVFKDTWYTQGVSIISDGWSNVKHNPLINVMAVNSRGAMFMYAEDFSGVEKTGVAISQFLLKAIEEVGASNVLQLVTDNAANCKAAGREIQKVHNHIFWSPCVVHTLNLIFKDFAQNFSWMSDTYQRGKSIVKFILNHSQALAIFRIYSKLELLKVAKTRFASHYILLKRLIDCREALAAIVVHKQWKEWSKSGDVATKTAGRLVVETINNEDFWDDVENIIRITKPLYLLIKFANGDGQKMGEIYEKMDNMVGEVRDIMGSSKFAFHQEKMEELILGRWEKMNIPLHCLAFALTPRFYNANYLATPAPRGTMRRPPNMDKEVIMGIMESISRIAEDQNEQKLLREQFTSFHMKKALFSMMSAQADAYSVNPIDWWSNYGSETPELAGIAIKVLSQPISSSSAERNWSTYSYIHSVKRNRLNCTTTDKLVFIHSNIRLLSRFSESYKDVSFKHWDIEPAATNLEDGDAKLNDMRWANLEDSDQEKEDQTPTTNLSEKQLGKRKK